MIILGISAFYHDAAAAIIVDGNLLAAAQEERFTRKKHDASFPSGAIRYCLECTGFDLADVDVVAFYDKPFLKFERLLETYYAFSPKGLLSFLRSMPVWMKEKLFLKKVIYDNLKAIGALDKKKTKLLFPEHHLSHAASAFYPSPYNESAILTIDGVGEWATASICHGEGGRITILKQLDFPHSPGLLYSAFTYYCGFKVNSGEYKLMGLAPYGSRDSKACKEMVDIIKTRLVTVKDDGSIFLHQEYFNYATGLRMVHDDKWETLFGFKKRESESPVADHHCNMALAIQIVTEEIVLKMAQEAKRVTGSDNICMAGGVALNCVANGKLHEAALFKNIFVQPAAGDAGGALGAAFAAWYIYLGKERIPVPGQDAMQGSFLGPAYNDKDIIATSVKYNAVYRLSENMEAMTVTTAKLIAEGNVIGWFQGRMEFGPRALGARSILADARNPDMQKRLNLKIKYRESFRPFAPSVLAEDVNDYFDLGEASPYMMLVKNIKQSMQYPVPDGYASRNLQDKLYFQRSDLPAVTHVDYSARIQTVHKETNPAFCQLLYAFKQQTGCSVLINTSFNVRGEPIVNTPAEAYRCFMETEMDYLVMGNYIFSKQDQPAWKRAIGKQIELSPD